MIRDWENVQVGGGEREAWKEGRKDIFYRFDSLQSVVSTLKKLEKEKKVESKNLGDKKKSINRSFPYLPSDRRSH